MGLEFLLEAQPLLANSFYYFAIVYLLLVLLLLNGDDFGKLYGRHWKKMMRGRNFVAIFNRYKILDILSHFNFVTCHINSRD